MNEEKLEELVIDLISILDNNQFVMNIKDLKKKLYLNKDISTLINEYQKSDYKSLDIKEKLYKNELFKDFKRNEIEINYLIMEINLILKAIKNERSCF